MKRQVAFALSAELSLARQRAPQRAPSIVLDSILHLKEEAARMPRWSSSQGGSAAFDVCGAVTAAPAGLQCVRHVLQANSLLVRTRVGTTEALATNCQADEAT